MDALLEDMAQQIAITEAAVTVLREGRMIRHRSIEAEAAEPAVGEIEVNLVAQSPLGPDAEAVADDQHPDHQLGIDGRTAR